MSGTEPTRPPADPLLREAALWFARMRGPDAAEHREAFEAWLRRGALHRTAYNRAAEIFADGKAALKPTRRVRPAFLLLPAALLAIACLFVLRPFLTTSSFTAEPAGGTTLALATATGETRTFNLADGSRVTLQGGSVLRLRFGHAERRLELSRGRVRFAVFHERRPFVVLAGGGSVTARGTVFDVALDDRRRVTVKLLEGTVDVSLPVAAGREPAPVLRQMRPGMVLSFVGAQDAHARPAPPTPAAAASPAPASVEDSRDFDAISLADLVKEANRNASPPLRVEDDRVGRQRVSGRFRIDDTSLLADRLAILFDLTADRSRPGEIVLRSR